MNLVLLEKAEIANGCAVVEGARARHVIEVLDGRPGQALRVGVRGGMMGEATIRSITDGAVELAVSLGQTPPSRPGIDLLLAIPRPKALKKLLPALASIGVDRVVLVNAARVEKSYFQSDVLSPTTIQRLFDDGLEQAKDTIAPQLSIEPRFKPFVEDRLEVTFPGGVRALAHPAAGPTFGALGPFPANSRVVFAIGPEGGWVPFELSLLEAHGFRAFTLGARTLRVETAVTALCGAYAALKTRADC